MMWRWHFKNLNGYAPKAGNYSKLDKGLTEEEMDVFYSQLGLRSFQSPKNANVIWALKWSPVILTDVDQESGHAVVAIGFEKDAYTLANPCATLSLHMERDADACVRRSRKNEGRCPWCETRQVYLVLVICPKLVFQSNEAGI
jgi:hypothetical protein